MKLRNILTLACLTLAAVSSAAELKWAKDYNSALKAAKTANKVVMVDFTAVWCVNCHKLDRTTYKDASVVKMLSNAVNVRVDFDKQPAIAKKYNVKALPVVLFLDSSGRELGRVNKYVDAKTFVSTVNPILKKAKK